MTRHTPCITLHQSPIFDLQKIREIGNLHYILTKKKIIKSRENGNYQESLMKVIQATKSRIVNGTLTQTCWSSYHLTKSRTASEITFVFSIPICSSIRAMRSSRLATDGHQISTNLEES